MYGLYLAAAGAEVQSRNLEVLSHNLANVDTPGFKPELAVFQARHAEAIEQGTKVPGTGGPDDVGGGVLLDQTMTDFQAGTFRTTGRREDLAIHTENAFFQVEKDGRTMLTRAGNFYFAADGSLRTQQGYPVLSSEGEPVLAETGIDYEFNRAGEVVQGGNRIALALVKPQSLDQLTRVGNNLFTSDGPLDRVPVTERNVVSGALEQSAVQPTVEMMRLIEASRAYEANVKLIQHHDQAIGELINRVMR